MDLGIETAGDVALSDPRFRRLLELFERRPGASVAPQVVCPTDVVEVSRILAAANEQGLKVVPVGSGSKLDRGTPPAKCDILLDMSKLSGIIEHAAGDMTVTVHAGTLLSDLQATVKLANQRLAIDPPFSGTIGGLIATGDSGPLRMRYGGVRDLLLGVTFVLADGTIAKGGGKVVKNVAGYDMPKLMTGALGTLGVIVEATFRLHPLPDASRTTVARDMSPQQARRLLTKWLENGLTPSAADYLLASRLFLVRWEGSEQSVQGQAEKAAALAKPVSDVGIVAQGEEQELWTKMDTVTATQENDLLARLICASGDLPRLLARAQELSHAVVDLEARAHIGHGHALLLVRDPDSESAISWLRTLRQEVEHAGGSLVLWRSTLAIRAEVEVWGDPGEGIELMRRVKAQFDPKSTLNPGRFVGGI